MLELIVNILALAVIPLVMAAYGGYLAAEMIADARERKKAKLIFWGLAVFGVFIVGYQQYLAHKADERHAKSATDQISTLAGLVLHPPQNPDTQAAVVALRDAIAALHVGKSESAVRKAAIASQPAQPPAVSQTPTSPVNPLASLSNEELKKRTLELAKKMRDFETAYRQREYNIILQRTTTDAEWQQKTQQELALSMDKQNEFRNQYLGEALSLRDEILRRLHETYQDPQHRLIAFEGILAGPSPISDAADYLESIARRLA